MADERNRRALVASADPEFGVIAPERPSPPARRGEPEPERNATLEERHVVPGSPTALYRRLTGPMARERRDTLESVLFAGIIAAIIAAALVVNTLERAAQDPWDSSSAKAWAFLIATAALVIGANRAIGHTSDRALARVDRTVLVDALRHRIVRVFDHADPGADDALRAFFAGR